MKSNESFIIILPLPPRVLHPNCAIGSIGGRFAVAAAAKKQKRLACEAVLASEVSSLPWDRVRVSATFYNKTRRRRDTDGATASLKSAYDGIVEAGVVKDDTPEFMKREEPVFDHDKIYPRLELKLERIL